MGTHYQHLCPEERNFIQRSLNQGLTINAIAGTIWFVWQSLLFW